MKDDNDPEGRVGIGKRRTMNRSKENVWRWN